MFQSCLLELSFTFPIVLRDRGFRRPSLRVGMKELAQSSSKAGRERCGSVHSGFSTRGCGRLP